MVSSWTYRYLILYVYYLVMCIDIDECAEGTDGCDQVCTNRIGSYNCSCSIGYRIARYDGHGCDGMMYTINSLFGLS